MARGEAASDVLVVGAGPSGLMAAVCLARLGVPVTVIDAKEGPTRESRALGPQARTMEIYDQLGLVDAVLDQGTVAPRVVPGHRSRAFAPVTLSGLGRGVTPYPGLYVLEQSRTEAILGEALLRLGGDLRWRHELTALDLVGPGGRVTATMRTPEGTTGLTARWCVGADGASSAVRRLLGIPFPGTTSPLTYYVADALGVRGLVDDAVNIRVSRDDFLLAFPMGGPGHHRLIGVVDEESERLEDRVRERLADEFAVAYDDAAWFTSYRVHHRLAARFRQGPVFLVGDAAHVHSPVGAQGMNTGLQDAHNLACALADVAAGRADERTLDRYEAERRPVAARVVRTTDAVFARVTSRGAVARFARDRLFPLVGPLALRVLPRLVGDRRLFGYLSQTRIRYRTLAGGRPDQAVGRRLAWTGANHAALRSFEWQVHSYGGAWPEGEVAGLPLHRFPADRLRRFDPDLLYLVRPDGFVAAATTAEGMSDALARALGRGGEAAATERPTPGTGPADGGDGGI